MFIERYRVDSSDAHAHLDFLSEKLPVSCCKDLLALKHPQRPIDVMRNRLVSYAAETERGIPIGENRTHAMRASVESLLYDVVARYYAVVDRAARNDIAEIVSMFSKHGVYDRAGKLLRGRREIAEFYTTERTLEGVHVGHSLVVDQLLAHVTGIFEGRSNASDSQRRLEFADTWRFDLHGYVTFRHTYLSAGHQLTT